jgi:hypothetical protein
MKLGAKCISFILCLPFVQVPNINMNGKRRNSVRFPTSLNGNLQYSRVGLLNVLNDESLRNEFKLYLTSKKETELLATRTFKFMDLYFRMHAALDRSPQSGADGKLATINYDDTVEFVMYHRIFQQFVDPQKVLGNNLVDVRRISKEVLNHILRFYCSFIITEAPDLLEYISDYTRSQTAKNMTGKRS